MKSLHWLPLLSALFILCGQSPAAESHLVDAEREQVKQGVLGTLNVLRELDPRSFTNRVTVTSNVAARDATTPDNTIDASGKVFRPKLDEATPLILTYALPGLRTISSLVIEYEYAANDAPTTVRMEGSPDGGQTWVEVFNNRTRKSDFLKLFKPIAANRLRLTLEGGGGRRIMEVFAYADSEHPLPLFGGADTGVFNFLRALWYEDKLTQLPSSKKNSVWTSHNSGVNVPDNLFRSEIAGMHRGCWGEGHEVGQRLYLRFDLDKAYPMNFGVIGCVEVNKGQDSWTLAGESQAEFYTANGKLDPGTLTGSSSQDLTAQGWILQKSWSSDPALCKRFLLEHPGQYNQMLLVWDCKKKWENNRFGKLEMFGVESSAKDAKAIR